MPDVWLPVSAGDELVLGRPAEKGAPYLDWGPGSLFGYRAKSGRINAFGAKKRTAVSRW